MKDRSIANDGLQESRQLTIAVLGTGSAGLRQLHILENTPGVKVIAVPTRPSRAAVLGDLGYAVAADLDEALAQKPDGVVIATDTGRHAVDAITCLEAGADVLIEKPLATTAKECEAVRAAAKRTKRSAHVACCMRFDPGLMWLRQQLPRLGALRAADIECLSWLPDWRPGRNVSQGYAARPGEGGVLLDLVHELDTSLRLFGPVQRVSARLYSSGTLGLDPKVEETAVLMLEHAVVGGRPESSDECTDGVTVTMRLSYAVRPPTRSVRIWGEHGKLEWNGIAHQASYIDTDNVRLGGISWASNAGMYEGQMDEWLHELRGVSAVDRSLCTLSDATASVQVCAAAREAARTKSFAEVA